MSRGGQARCRAIPGSQHLCEAAGSPSAQPNFDYCSNNCADHMFQKPVGVGFDEDLVVMADDSESLEMADGIYVGREASFEGGKVLRSDQRRCRLLHGGVIQWPVNMPYECAIDRGAGWTMKDPIGVEFATCIMLGVKAGVGEGSGTNGNVFR